VLRKEKEGRTERSGAGIGIGTGTRVPKTRVPCRNRASQTRCATINSSFSNSR